MLYETRFSSGTFLFFEFVGDKAHAQLGLFSPEQRIAFSPQWQGERFSDGRPKVPDVVVQRLGETTAEQAWDVLQEAGFRNQFEGGFQIINPGQRMVGGP